MACEHFFVEITRGAYPAYISAIIEITVLGRRTYVRTYVLVRVACSAQLSTSTDRYMIE